MPPFIRPGSLALVLIAVATLGSAQDPELPLTSHSGDVRALAFSPDGKWLASGAGEGEVRVWDVESGACLRTMKAHDQGTDAVAFSVDGLWIISGGNDKTVKLWNRNTGELAHTFKGHEKRVLAVALSRDGKRLATGSAEGRILLWDLKTKKLIGKADTAHLSAVACLTFGAKGKVLYSGGWDKKFRMWTVPELFPKGAGLGNDIVLSLAVDRAGKHVAVGTKEGDVVVRKLKKMKIVGKFATAAREVRSVDLHPNKKRPHVLLSGLDGRIEIWDYKKKKKLHDFHGHEGPVPVARFSPDGKWIASGGDDTAIRFWRVPK